jgi:hypothetical protein
MKRVLLVVACLALAFPMLAEKARHRRPSSPLATNTINGSPLQIVIGDDASMQVYNSNVPGTGQFYPPDTVPGETTEGGVSVRINGVTYGPDDTGWTPVSMTPVTGTGTSVDPFTVVIVADAGSTGLRMTETLTYVNGSSQCNISLAFSNTTDVALTFDAFIGADLYLADNDAGYPYAVPGSAAGSHAANSACTQQLQYTIAFLGTTPADHYSANGYFTVWNEISAGQLSDTIAPGCLDDGAALQWSGRALAVGASLTINTGVSFTGQAVPVGSVVPALSTVGLAALVLLLAVVGYVLARKSSLGA